MIHFIYHFVRYLDKILLRCHLQSTLLFKQNRPTFVKTLLKRVVFVFQSDKNLVSSKTYIQSLKPGKITSRERFGVIKERVLIPSTAWCSTVVTMGPHLTGQGARDQKRRNV